MRIVYGVITTGKYHPTRCEAILRTWGNRPNVRLFTDIDAEDDGRYVKVTERSEYEYAYLKLMDGFKWLWEKYDDYDWFCFCDDDAYIFTDSLERFLATQDPNKPVAYGEIKNTLAADPSLYYPLGGAGVVLSRAALSAIYPRLCERGYKTCNWGDVTLGYVLKECGVELVNDRRFHSQIHYHDEYKLPTNVALTDNFSFHYVTPDLMSVFNALEVRRGRTIHVVGDSHCYGFEVFNGKPEIGANRFHAIHLGPRTAHMLANHDDQVESDVVGVVGNDKVIFFFGEIDCRIHIYNKSTGSRCRWMEGISQTAENYASYLFNLSRNHALNLHVMSVLPTGVQDNHYKYPYYPTYEVRKEITECFNKCLASKCAWYGIPFIDIHKHMVDVNGDRLQSLVRDEVHCDYPIQAARLCL